MRNPADGRICATPIFNVDARAFPLYSQLFRDIGGEVISMRDQSGLFGHPHALLKRFAGILTWPVPTAYRARRLSHKQWQTILRAVSAAGVVATAMLAVVGSGTLSLFCLAATVIILGGLLTSALTGWKRPLSADADTSEPDDRQNDPDR